jgi:hypothetical protein
MRIPLRYIKLLQTRLVPMFIEILRAASFAAIPVLIIAYLMVSRAILSNRLARFADNKSLKSAMEDMSKKYKEDKKKKTDVQGINQGIINKWLYFGGGFYGLMAFITYVAIEGREIAAFVGKLFDLKWSQLLSSVSFQLLVDMLVESTLNLVDAFLWFRYWPDEINMKNGWYWLLAAYLGYLLGARLAEKYPMRYSLKDVFKNSSNSPERDKE